MDRVLCLSAEQRQQIAAWAASAYPEEGCGLLLGRGDGRETRVVAVRRARNIRTERARDRYEIDPADYLAAETAASDAGIEVVGIWHSHPDHPARPSPTDRESAWAGWSYLIAAVAAGELVELRSWRLNGDGCFEEEEICS